MKLSLWHFLFCTTLLFWSSTLSAQGRNNANQTTEKTSLEEGLPRGTLLRENESIFTTKAKLFATGFAQPEALAADALGNIYIADYRFRGAIGKITPDGSASIFTLLPEYLEEGERDLQITGLRIDNNGQVVGTESKTNSLFLVDLAGETVEILADRYLGRQFQNLCDLAIAPNGDIYFLDAGDSDKTNSGTLYRFNIVEKKVETVFENLDRPRTLAVDPIKNEIFLTEEGKSRLLHLRFATIENSENRALVDLREIAYFPPQGSDLPGLRFGGIAFDQKGHIYLSMTVQSSETSNGSENNVSQEGLNALLTEEKSLAKKTEPSSQLIVLNPQTGKVLETLAVGRGRVTDLHFFENHLYLTLPDKEAVFHIESRYKGFLYTPFQR